ELRRGPLFTVQHFNPRQGVFRTVEQPEELVHFTERSTQVDLHSVPLCGGYCALWHGHKHQDTQTHTHTHSRIYTHTRAHTHTHTHTHTDAHIPTHKHKHIPTRSCISLPKVSCVLIGFG